MASKLAEQQTNKFRVNFNTKIPPLPLTSKRRLNRLTPSQNLIAPAEKVEVPNHLLNTSINN